MKRIAEEDLLHVLKHTESIMDALRNKNIFITGATGFFGKWLLESFLFINKHLSLNATITALSRNPEAFLVKYPFYKNEESISFVKGDIQTFEFPSKTFEFIIHAATDADAKLNEENPLLMLDTIIMGTNNILNFAKMQPLESFLLTSSGAIYGRQPAYIEHIKEEESYPVNINDRDSAYAEGKRIAELYCSAYHKHYQLPVKIARCFAFVGPHLSLDKHFAIGNFILNALKGEDITIKGDGSAYRSYLYAADLTIWLWNILLKGKINTPYNVGSDFSLSIKETAEHVARRFNSSIDLRILETPSGKPVHRYVPDVIKAKTDLNLEIYFDIDQSIDRTVQFYKDVVLHVE